MQSRFFLVLFALTVQGGTAFLAQNGQHSVTTTSLKAAESNFDVLIRMVNNYEVTVKKPLGVVFGENPDPYYGLVVDDVAEGQNGGIAGLKVGDQLLAINENVVVGKSFDNTMDMLVEADESLNLVLFRGPVSQLFTILSNQLEEGVSYFDDDEEDDEDNAPVIMDENYESPVKVEVKEQKPLTPGDFVKAFGKVASMAGEALKPDENAPPPAEKKKGGWFGFGETVQLDGAEALGYRKEGKKKPEDDL